jgi:glycerophosphoryl diester phosphodiesterase
MSSGARLVSVALLFFAALLPALAAGSSIRVRQNVTVARAFSYHRRGASAVAPENTLLRSAKPSRWGGYPRARCAPDEGFTTRRHPRWSADRTTSGSGNIGDLSLEELRRLDAGSWFDPKFANERIPTLAQVFDSIPRPCTFLVEIKEGSAASPGIEARVVKLVHDRRIENRVILKSFDDAILDSLRRIAPELPRLKIIVTQFSLLNIIIEHGVNFGTVFDDSVQYLQHHWFGLTKGFVTEAHEHGYGVFVWDVNDVERMKEFVLMGVDGIETDYPDLLASVIAHK